MLSTIASIAFVCAISFAGIFSFGSIAVEGLQEFFGNRAM